MNFLALFAAGKILGMKLKLVRLLLSAMFGAIYCIFTLFFVEIIIPVIILNIAVSIIMCLIAFKTDTFIRFIKAFVIFYAACFILGGGIEALYNLSGFFNTGEPNNAPPFQVIIILELICTAIFIFTGLLFKLNAAVKEIEIRIGFGRRELILNAIIDTGNLLRDPVSSLPVIIINLHAAANLFDLNILTKFNTVLRMILRFFWRFIFQTRVLSSEK
jgi:stage II sporulation protein GA (sporulation sigma-E factor processing peptidase)